MVTLHDPEAVGFSKARLSRIQPVMQSYIDDNKYPALITLLARHGHVVYLECYGLMNVEARQPVRPDVLCNLASMSKPITCVAALMLFEQGFFQLNDPIAKFLPAAKDLKVCVHATDADLQLVDLARAPTMRDLFTHTAGFAYWTPDGHLLSERFAALDSLHPTTLQQYVEGVLALPLLHQPGSMWRYSPSLDVLAHIVEMIADMPFDEFVHRNITEPLAMEDTGYVVPDHKVDRLMSVYAPNDHGGHDRTGPDPADYRPPQVPYGGGGMYSTVVDYARFVQMLLNGGQLDGKRLLGRKTVELMLTNHLPATVLPSFDVVVLSRGYYTKGYGFGLGVRVLMNPAENEILGSVGNFGWGGSTNTYFWGDPREGLIGMIWAQSDRPIYAYPLERQFMTLAYQALAD
jgi:CubicO group peptidase (beta-lactamase class C family)